jgi:hypothetical protein
MVYSISASLYYSIISMLLDYPIFQSISYLEWLKNPNFISLFEFLHNLTKIKKIYNNSVGLIRKSLNLIIVNIIFFKNI